MSTFAYFDGRDSTPRPDTASLISQVNRGFLQAVQLHSCKNCKNVLASVPSAGVRPALDFYILARRVKQQLLSQISKGHRNAGGLQHQGITSQAPLNEHENGIIMV